MLEKLFRSNTLIRVLGIVLFQDGLHLRDIARKSDLPPSQVKRELDNLINIGFLSAEKKGRQKFFYLNHSCPFLSELKKLYLKTEGIFINLKRSLKNIKGIKYAFIFGSIANERETKRSDVDLMIIGDVDELELTKEMLKVQKIITREINFIVWSESDLQTKIKQKSGFVRNLYSGKRIWLFGDEDEFNRTLKEEFDRKD
jgi:predicted nucleotidyltransferase